MDKHYECNLKLSGLGPPCWGFNRGCRSFLSPLIISTFITSDSNDDQLFLVVLTAVMKSLLASLSLTHVAEELLNHRWRQGNLNKSVNSWLLSLAQCFLADSHENKDHASHFLVFIICINELD